MFDGIPENTKRVVLYMTEEQYQALHDLAERRGERAGIGDRVSVSALMRSIAKGKYRLVRTGAKIPTPVLELD